MISVEFRIDSNKTVLPLMFAFTNYNKVTRIIITQFAIRQLIIALMKIFVQRPSGRSHIYSLNVTRAGEISRLSEELYEHSSYNKNRHANKRARNYGGYTEINKTATYTQIFTRKKKLQERIDETKLTKKKKGKTQLTLIHEKCNPYTDNL